MKIGNSCHWKVQAVTRSIVSLSLCNCRNAEVLAMHNTFCDSKNLLKETVTEWCNTWTLLATNFWKTWSCSIFCGVTFCSISQWIHALDVEWLSKETGHNSKFSVQHPSTDIAGRKLESSNWTSSKKKLYFLVWKRFNDVSVRVKAGVGAWSSPIDHKLL